MARLLASVGRGVLGGMGTIAVLPYPAPPRVILESFEGEPPARLIRFGYVWERSGARGDLRDYALVSATPSGSSGTTGWDPSVSG
ncbi:hypothetical protein GCM10025864_39720 [Luteimicrobium album]|uniref:Uncharacterized protein n=1 Tax=Luteimicrobium album TaxID=1054550 RepID=A0ABQ6I8C3_9MICO|nr:hypothetical protein GCM10025864_39720 [Luteimicrobium album]